MHNPHSHALLCRVLHIFVLLTGPTVNLDGWGGAVRDWVLVPPDSLQREGLRGAGITVCCYPPSRQDLFGTI